jgi:hypothetical protein
MTLARVNLAGQHPAIEPECGGAPFGGCLEREDIQDEATNSVRATRVAGIGETRDAVKVRSF